MDTRGPVLVKNDTRCSMLDTGLEDMKFMITLIVIEYPESSIQDLAAKTAILPLVWNYRLKPQISNRVIGGLALI